MNVNIPANEGLTAQRLFIVFASNRFVDESVAQKLILCTDVVIGSLL